MVSNTHSIEQNPNLPELINQQTNEQTCAPHLFSVRSVTTENTDVSPKAIPLTVLATEGSKGGKAGEGGFFSTVETDPNPGLPRPQPGDTLRPGWGDRVSMEYRLRVASEEECIECAKEFWQLDLVAKERYAGLQRFQKRYQEFGFGRKAGGCRSY